MNPIQKFSKVDKCPSCFRMLCKRVLEENVLIIQMKHRGYEAYAKDAVIICMGCKKRYLINNDQGIVRTVTESISGQTPGQEPENTSLSRRTA